ncbi:MAG: 30S ribosomal protein S19e [Candidatus Diapherotrites archaeon]|nr:30S ribosomal protein S19e [Candidatus Diapherotrites archaeon]
MSTRDVSPGRLIDELAGTMKKEGIVNPPQWAKFVKTGAHAQRPPHDPNWWYVRAASVLRQVYMRGPVGVQKLRNWYGGRKNRGAKPERHYPAGGKVIRLCLQQLEAAGLIAKEGNGRKITAKGQSLLDKTAAKVAPRREAKPKPTTKEKAPARKPTAKKEAKPKKGAEPKKEKAKPRKEPEPKPEKKEAKPAKKAEPKKEEATPEPEKEEATPEPEKKEATPKPKEAKPAEKKEEKPAKKAGKPAEPKEEKE